jgi:transposase IS116/IS110/IS902 family protein
VLAKQGVQVPVSDLFGVGGTKLLNELALDAPFHARVLSLRRLIDAFTFEIDIVAERTGAQLRAHPGFRAIQAIDGVGPVLAAVFLAEIGDVARFARPEQLCSWVGMTPAAPRVRHQGPPGPDHQAGQPSGPLGRRRGRATPLRRRDRVHPGPVGRTPRREHRQGRRRP